MENEIMNYEEVMEPEVETYEVETEESGMSTGVAMLIGAGLTAVSIAAVKLGKKALFALKAKKEARETYEEDDVEVIYEEEDATK